MGTRFEPYEILVPALAGLVASCLVVYATGVYGAAISTDVIGYIAQARNLLQGNGWAGISGSPQYLYPPVFQSVLALVGLLGVDPQDSLRWVNAAAHGLTVGLLAWWVCRRFESPLVGVLTVVALVASPVHIWMASQGLSESVFMLFVAGALVLAERYWRRGGERAALLGFAACSALALGTRYPGAVLVPLGIGLIWLVPGLPRARRMADGATFSALAVSIGVAWLIRNQILVGTMFGSRSDPSANLSEVASLYLVEMWGWLFSGTLGPGWNYAPLSIPARGVTIVALLVIAVSAAYVFWKMLRGRVAGGWGGLLVFGGFSVLYVAFIVVTKSRVGNPEYRYLVPALPFLLVATGCLCNQAVAQFNAGGGRRVVVTMPVACGVWLAVHAFPVTLQVLDSCRTKGTGYYSMATYSTWQILPYLESSEFRGLLQKDTVILSTLPDAVYWKSHHTTGSLPRVGDQQEARIGTFRATVERQAERGAETLVVAISKNADKFVPFERLAREVRFVFLREMPDHSGAVFRVLPMKTAETPAGWNS
ncbi:MAG: glycosyltransferase family 39 protein [Nitrospirota bacterium]|nr:glycosyltransferase family 39 protein [Nitrospirota bacterium]